MVERLAGEKCKYKPEMSKLASWSRGKLWLEMKLDLFELKASALVTLCRSVDSYFKVFGTASFDSNFMG